MHKISIQWKIRFVILFYCFMITGVFVFMSVYLQYELRTPDIDSYISTIAKDTQGLPGTEYDSENSGAIINPDDNNSFNNKIKDEDQSEMKLYRNLSDYSTFFNQQITEKLIPLTFVVAIFIIASSFLLWIIIKKLQLKNNMQIADKFENIKDFDELPQMDDTMKHAFLKIKDEYAKHMKEYQRLHSYLSHEQKNAIALLRNNLDLQHFDRCEKNIDYIANSIDDILTLSDGDYGSELQKVDILLICASVCDTYAIMQPNITFSFDEEEAFVLGKERWLYRAVSNIMDNAVKYGNGQPIEVSLTVKKGSIIVMIKDHGIGICEEKQQKIFNHQYRINELNKDGYGIGLNLVSHVCDLCGGFVTFESTVNVGTVFYLSFPLAKK